MAPNSRVVKAFRARRYLGIREKKTKPVLKNLFRIYEYNWDLIEEEDYRALADAIFYSENTLACLQNFFFIVCASVHIYEKKYRVITMTSGGVLEVTLVDSEDIRAKKFLGCIMSCACSTSAVKRPYVCVEYGEQKRVSKVAAGKGKKSIWDQKFEFEIDYSPEEKKSTQKLVFRVMDKHKLSDDEYIGEARIYVKDVISSGMEEGEAELESRKYRVVREDQTYTGDVSVAVTFKRKEGGIKASLVNHEEITKFPIS
nr:hypothetical protein [Tanacetum cinerariifolium]